MTNDLGSRAIPSKGVGELLAVSIIAGLVAVVGGIVTILIVQNVGPGKGTPVFGFPELLLTLTGLSAFGVGLILLFWCRTPRSVMLTGDGVRIIYPVRSYSFPWHEMMRVVGVGLGTVTFRRTSDPTNIVGGWFNISLEQARAILSDPRCPPVDLRDDWRRSIFQV